MTETSALWNTCLLKASGQKNTSQTFSKSIQPTLGPRLNWLTNQLWPDGGQRLKKKETPLTRKKGGRLYPILKSYLVLWRILTALVSPVADSSTRETVWSVISQHYRPFTRPNHPFYDSAQGLSASFSDPDLSL